MLIIHGLKLGGEQLDPWMQVVTPAAFVIAGACDYYAERMLFPNMPSSIAGCMTSSARA